MRVALSLLLLTIAACQGNRPDQSSAIDPNIIFIMADDLGYGDVGAYGQELIKTPHIDRLAAEGMKFTQFYAGTSVCAPSRAVLMTGLHNGHAEIRGNKQLGIRQGQQPISSGTMTVARHLQKEGYVTGMIGKWGLGNPGTTGDPMEQGWDYYFGYTDQVLAHNYYPEFLLRNGEKVMLKNQVKYLDSTLWHKGLGSYATEKVEYSHDLFMDDAIQFIDTYQDTTFFLYLPLTIPHDNGEALPDQQQEVPDQGIYEARDWDKTTKDYAAMITRMDSGVGDLMRHLKELGLDENTLVFFTSDNGPMPGEAFTEFVNSNGPLRGGKRALYEGGIRVPFIARWPGRISAGVVSDHVGAFWDVLPTFTQLADQRTPLGIDGISFLPTLLGEPSQTQHQNLYWEFHEQTGSQAIRQGNWKAVRLDAKVNPTNPVELYDLASDLGEQKNVADKFPDKAAELDSLMTTSRTESSLFPFAK